MATTKWIVDPMHSEIGFKIKHLMITNVKGFFNDFRIEAETEEEDFMTAKIFAKIATKSIHTGNDDRDHHLKSPEFFDIGTFPEINFAATRYEKVDRDGSYDISGDLTIKGVTHKVKFGVEFGGVVIDPWGATKAGFTINGKINRKDFGLNWNQALETGGVLLSDTVNIVCDIQLLKAP
jgi:polyisoprenoid-binding protein YceI